MSNNNLGIFSIYTSSQANNLLYIIEIILKTLKNLKTKINSKYFELIRDIDRKNIKMALDTTVGITGWYADEIIYKYPKIRTPDDYIKLYNKITLKNLFQSADEIFDFNKINITILSKFSRNNTQLLKQNIDKLVLKYG